MYAYFMISLPKKTVPSSISIRICMWR